MGPVPLVILTGRTSEAVEGVDRTRKVRMRQINTGVQDRDADSTAIGGARRYADSHHASGNDLRLAASSASRLAFPAHAAHVLIDLIRKDGRFGITASTAGSFWRAANALAFGTLTAAA
jgi:hypothetical protein